MSKYEEKAKKALGSFLQAEEYRSPLSECVRFAVSQAVTSKKLVKRARIPDKDRILHSLVVGWLEKNNYGLAAVALKAQMGPNYVKNPSDFLDESPEILSNVTLNLREELEFIEMPVVARKSVDVSRKTPARTITRIAPIDIDPVEEYRTTVLEDLKKQDIAIKKSVELHEKIKGAKAESSESSTTTSGSTSSSSSSDEEETEEENGSSKSSEGSFEDLSEKPISVPSISSPSSPSWFTSEQGLTTDVIIAKPVKSGGDKPASLFPAINNFLPNIPNMPKMEKEPEPKEPEQKDSEPKESEPKEPEPKELEPKKQEPKEPGKKEPEQNKEDDDSISELDEFDTGLLSSGESDFSF